MDKFTIKNLDLFYGDFQALKSIHLALPANEITALSVHPAVENRLF